MEKQELAKQLKALFSGKAVLLVLVFLSALIVSIRISRKLDTRKGRGKASHAAEAFLKKSSVYRHGNGKYGDVNDPISAAYTYTVGEKTYEYRYWAKAVPARSITLYYKHNPGRAWWGEERSFAKSVLQVLLVLMPFAVTVLVGLVIGIQ